MVVLPRLVVAAPSTGSGKTTVATGLMAALRSTGLEVSGHKVGPDYIDPGYHALATGRPGRNLDPHLVGEDLVVPLLLHGARGADVAVLEGVMGLHDGRLGTDGFASTAHVAALTSSPVVLVLDVGRMSRSAAAIAVGMASFDPSVRIGGVVLNRSRPGRNEDEIIRGLEQAGLTVLGALPYDDTLATPSRHLGLVPVAERDESVAMVQRLGEQVAAHLDLDGLLALAASAPDLAAEPWDPRAEVVAAGHARPVVAVAGGRAFTFRYPETTELLEAAGCEVVAFDPLVDDRLPDGTRGLYLGGGFPEVYAGELAGNRNLLAEVRAAVEAGVPTVAECAGLLYLADSLDGVAMAGVVPATAVMSDRLTLRYPEAVAVADSLLTRAGERVTGHEFHRTTTTPESGCPAAWVIDGTAGGFAHESLHASYLHTHWAGHPQLAQRFADAVHAAVPYRSSAPTATGDPLLHHGDAETAPGLLDLAVNVYDGPRPAWLDDALHGAIDRAAAYPDVRPATAALARRHDLRSDEVLVTAGAAEAFTLVARLRPWSRPAVVHPQFTEPHAALEAAGHAVTTVPCRADFTFDPTAVPDDADLVVLGNPTNPTGVLHPASSIRSLLRPGRVVVVDEAFLDTVPGEPESLLAARRPGLLVTRSLTKHWSVPGIRAGYVAGDPELVAGLARIQPPWSVSGPAIAAVLACTTPTAVAESERRAQELVAWRTALEAALAVRGIEHVPSRTSFVLARLGVGAREQLRARDVAVRRCDTFPGLDASWVRIAARPPATLARFLVALDEVSVPHSQGAPA